MPAGEKKSKPATDRLSLAERWAFTWQLVWPLAVIDALAAIAVHSIAEPQMASNLDGYYQLLSMVLVAPFVVKRAMGLTYPTFHFRILRMGQERPINYTESFKIMWLLSWRMTAALLVLVLPVSFLLSRLSTRSLADMLRDSGASGGLTGALLFVAFNIVSSAILLPFLIPGMVKKQYRGFIVEVMR